MKVHQGVRRKNRGLIWAAKSLNCFCIRFIQYLHPPGLCQLNGDNDSYVHHIVRKCFLPKVYSCGNKSCLHIGCHNLCNASLSKKKFSTLVIA